MNSYMVVWEIDVDAESPVEAARKALETQRNPESIAAVFGVRRTNSKGAPFDEPQVIVDLRGTADDELTRLEAEFAATGGRGVDLAERIEYLRGVVAKRRRLTR